MPLSGGILPMPGDMHPLPVDIGRMSSGPKRHRLAATQCPLTLIRCHRTEAALGRPPSIAKPCEPLPAGIARRRPATCHGRLARTHSLAIGAVVRRQGFMACFSKACPPATKPCRRAARRISEP